MARGRGGIRTERQYLVLTRPGRGAFEAQVVVVEYARTEPARVFGHDRSFRQSFHAVHGRYPSGQDYRRRDEFVGDVWSTGRIAATDRLARAPMPVPTADGIYETRDISWRQRSLVGDYWGVVGRAGRMTDAELRAALKPFRGKSLRVFDPELGRVVRKPFETNPKFVRQFASSPEARAERVISPKFGSWVS